jgi:hypothetical protein
MEKPTFTKMNLFDVRVIMVIMHILVRELLCQAVTGWIPVLECPILWHVWLLWLCPVMSGIKCCHLPRTRLKCRLPGTGEPRGVDTRGPGCVLSQGLRIRRAGLIGGEILPTCGY